MCVNNQIALENPITVTDPRIQLCGTFCAKFDPAQPPTMLPAAMVAAMGQSTSPFHINAQIATKLNVIAK